jgi:hypothetical protein
MKNLRLILFCFILAGFSSCYTTNNAIISNSANLLKYNYATISDVMGYSGSAALMDLEVKIYDILSSSRLKMIGEKQIETFSEIQKQELLLVKYSATQSDLESVVSINFVEYLTGRPVASCRGAFGLGFSREHDMSVAVDNALTQVKKLF